MSVLGMILIMSGAMFFAVSFLAFRAPGGIMRKYNDDPDGELILKVLGILRWLTRGLAFMMIIVGAVLLMFGSI